MVLLGLLLPHVIMARGKAREDIRLSCSCLLLCCSQLSLQSRQLLSHMRGLLVMMLGCLRWLLMRGCSGILTVLLLQLSGVNGSPWLLLLHGLMVKPCCWLLWGSRLVRHPKPVHVRGLLLLLCCCSCIMQPGCLLQHSSLFTCSLAGSCCCFSGLVHDLSSSMLNI